MLDSLFGGRAFPSALGCPLLGAHLGSTELLSCCGDFSASVSEGLREFTAELFDDTLVCSTISSTLLVFSSRLGLDLAGPLAGRDSLVHRASRFVTRQRGSGVCVGLILLRRKRNVFGSHA